MNPKNQSDMADKFDEEKCRHYMGKFTTVLHSHHYAALFSQLADDALEFNGILHLQRASEDTFYELLDQYFSQNQIETDGDKIRIAEQYWEKAGMGKIRFTGVGKYAAAAEMEYSHVDQGWSEKWGGRDKPVNFITQGFVAAVVALFNRKPLRSFTVKETRSLICGHPISVFKAVAE